jgi:polysaccharide export outer membrane protein
MKVFLTFLVLVTLFFSCKTTNFFLMKNKERKESIVELDSNFRFNESYQYTIRKNDKISISVWQQDELSVGSVYGVYNSNEIYGKWLLVDDNGTIDIPRLGTQVVEGMTILQLKNYLKTEFGKWLVNPIVDVKVLNKQIAILGEVRAPQAITIDKDENSLLEVIAKAGGLEFYADLKYVKIMRPFGDSVLVENIDLRKAGNYMDKNIQLHPGDVVFVPSKKYKQFDKRISTIIPFTTTLSTFAVLFGVFNN